MDVMPDDADTIEGLLMTSSAARNDADYIKFMALYQASFGEGIVSRCLCYHHLKDTDIY